MIDARVCGLTAPQCDVFEQGLLERHKEVAEKLEDVCDGLTLTENRLIGHQQQAENAESVTDLQQYQQEHQVGTASEQT